MKRPDFLNALPPTSWGRTLALLRILPLIAILSGCASGHGPEAPTDALTPHGWRQPAAVLTGDTFADYARDVSTLLHRSRLPFDPSRATEEIRMAAPREYRPSIDTHCAGTSSRGIVLLVHGLSDSAWIMHDIASHLAHRCFVVRTLLLPGHGTRPGDLLKVGASDWQATLERHIDIATRETSTLIVGGFSLGAVLATRAALLHPDDIDAVIALAPAYSLSSEPLVRLTPLARWFKPWLDRGVADDAMRYEAMPTRGVAETVRTMRRLHRELRKAGQLHQPWLLVQSLDDAVIVPERNAALFGRHAAHPSSRLVQIYSEQPIDTDASGTTWLKGNDERFRSLGVTHAATPNAPDNPHYGIHGRYRNCGSTAPRERLAVQACEQAERVWYGTWNREDAANVPTARGTFNAAFDAMTDEMDRFLEEAL